MAIALLTSCDVEPAPVAADVEVAPRTVDLDVMYAEPDVTWAGEEVRVWWPSEQQRGVGYWMERHVDGEWLPTYRVLAGSPSHTCDPLAGPFGAGPDIPDVEANGRGPEVVPVPLTAVPGRYRYCNEVSATRAMCAPVTVVPRF